MQATLGPVDDTQTDTDWGEQFLKSDRRLPLVCDQLETISELLGEVSFDLLRNAAENGATRRPAQDKALAQARRAVEKAARILATYR